MLEKLLDAGDDLHGQWLGFLTLEDLKMLSSVGSAASFSSLRQLVVERAVWRLPYPPTLRCVDGRVPTVQETAFDFDMYEKATYLGSMDVRTKLSLRKVSVPRSVLLRYVATQLPNVDSVHVVQFKGDVGGIDRLSPIQRNRVRDQLRTVDLLDVTDSSTWRQLSLDRVHVTAIHVIAALTSLQSLKISNASARPGSLGFEYVSSLVQLTSLHLEQCQWLANLVGVESFNQLTTLHISGLGLVSLEGIAHIPALTSLEIKHVWLENAVVPLAGLTRLQNLCVVSLGAGDPLDVQLNAPELKTCSFRQCWLLNYDFLAQSPKLKDLDVGNPIRHEEAPLPRLPALERVRISSNPAAIRCFDWFSSPLLQHIHFDSWKPASVNNEEVDGSFLTSLPYLRSVEIEKLSQFRLDQDLLVNLTTIILRQLEIRDEETIKRLVSSTRRLQTLHLYARTGFELTLPTPSHPELLRELEMTTVSVKNISILGQFHGLRRLRLDNTIHESAAFGCVHNLVSLKALTITRNLAFDDVSVLTALPMLEYLSLQHTNVKDVSKLATMITLQELELSFTLVSDVSMLGPLVHLRRISLPYVVDCGIFQDAMTFPLLRSVLHIDLSHRELDCCVTGHGAVVPW